MIRCLVLNKIIPLVDVSHRDYVTRNSLTVRDVAKEHAWTYKSRGMNFDKDLSLKGKYCYHPFNTITVDGAGDVYVCVCQAWLPISVGKIWDFDSLQAIVQSPKAREIQATIIDGSYKYCDHNTCSIIQEGELENRIDHRPDTVNWINFALDSSCNLTCPSCRKDFVFINEGPEFDRRIKIVDHLIKLIEQHDHWIKFSLSGDGDPFASLIYRYFLTTLNLENKQDVEIEIVTNGNLLEAHWHKLAKIYKQLVRVKISFDAGSKEVYDVTRRGGDWNKLLNGIKHLVKWKQKNYSDTVITANFVVQTANYRDMPEYVKVCNQLGINEINFQKIVDWGTFDNFFNQAVWNKNHPEHENFLNILKDPVFKDSKINWTNLWDIVNEIK